MYFGYNCLLLLALGWSAFSVLQDFFFRLEALKSFKLRLYHRADENLVWVTV
ncbi:hypothetical protein CCFV1_ORF076 [Cotesia congregata filamentous virus 1]|uniref:Uncharacterized protein n=1 Tax=Cotesia congregata filamentous virus 1 TaxID=3064291 RepID=A0ABC8QJP8_9VIRU|nr:hypothetical protein CCFV1_ORF076 [Cotesia congregata filamentous virus 1]